MIRTESSLPGTGHLAADLPGISGPGSSPSCHLKRPCVRRVFTFPLFLLLLCPTWTFSLPRLFNDPIPHLLRSLVNLSLMSVQGCFPKLRFHAHQHRVPEQRPMASLSLALCSGFWFLFPLPFTFFLHCELRL